MYQARWISTRDYLAGPGASRLSGVPDHLAVDENLFDADRKFLRFFEGGAIKDSIGIKKDEVGDAAFLEDSSIRPVEAVRGKRSHVADGVGKREPVFFADEAAKDARKSAGAARVFNADAAITGDHDPRLLVESLDIAFDHRMSDDASFGIGGVAFAN